jgi:hypothetical protein
MTEAEEFYRKLFEKKKSTTLPSNSDNINYITVLTNEFLKTFDFEKSSVFPKAEEAPDGAIHQKQTQAILGANLGRMMAKDNIQAYVNNAETQGEQTVLSKLAFLKYFHNKEIRNQMKDQLKECEKLLDSDMSKRNLSLRKEVEIEAEKLRIGLKYDLITIATNSLYDMYTYIYQGETKTDTYVRISESMHHMEIYNRKPFPTLNEAFDRLKDDAQVYPFEAKRILYLRVKNHIVYDRNQFLIK